MIKPICRMGNPILRQKAALISPDYLQDAAFLRLLEDLQDSMRHYGGIGIAAPQIGVSLQLAIIDLPATNRYQQMVSLPLTVFINPQIEILNDERSGYWEGCLSVPGLRGYVERAQWIRVSYLDSSGQGQVLEARGFLATVLQHELDHLAGILYIDRLKGPEYLAFQEEYEAYILPALNQ